MKKLLTFFLTALLAFSVGWAEEVSVTFSDLYSSNTVLTDVTIPLGNDVSITFAKPAGTAPQYYTNGTAVRWYARNTMTVTSTQTITKIVLTFGNGDGSNTITTDVGSYSNGTWTGSALSVLFTVGGTSGNRRLSAVTVTYSSGPVADNWYRKVTSASDLFAGNKYIIVNEANSAGMGELNSNRFGTGVTGLTFENDRVNIGGTNVMEMILGGTTDAWTFRMGEDGNYLSDSNEGNNAFFPSTSVNSSSTDITKWTITPGANAQIQSNYATSQYIRFNSSGLFGTYGVNAQLPVALYVQDDGTTGVANIAEALAFTGTTFRFAGSAVVTYQNGDNLWIRDASGSGLIYGSVNGTFANGAVLEAGWTATNSTSNQGVPQFTSPSGVSSSSSTTAAPEAMTTFTTADVNKYVSISNVTITRNDGSNYYYEENGDEYCLRNHFGSVPLTVGKTYNVVGVVSIYGNAAQVYLISAEELAVPTLLVSPNPLTFNDSGTGNTITVEGSNLGGDNVGLTQNGSYFTPTLTASTGWATDGGTYWYFSPNNGSLNGTVAMSYTGRDLSASETVTLANNKASATVTVNYRSDVYILGNYGSGWDYSNGILMTYDATNNTYTANVTVDAGNLIVFARKLGESNPWNTRILFGPNSNGDCSVYGDFTGTIDLNDDDPIVFVNGGTYTIEINATTGALTITKEVVNTGDFELVTNVSDLNAGDEVIFVNSGTAGSALAMSTTQNSNNRGTTDVTVSTTFKVTADDPVQIATLEASGDGNWYFNVGNGYLYAASSSGNQLKTQSTTSDNAKARITIGSGNVANIVFQGSNTRNTMQFNGTIVSCYGSASQSPVYLYKRGGSTEPSITVNPTSLGLVIPADGNSVDGTVTVTETNTTGTTSVSISGTGASHFTATLNNGTLTVTYSGTATQANPDQATITLTNGTATATVTVTGYKRVQASGTLYNKVTSADQIQDGLQYILVYEGTPEAINDITTSTGGTGAAVIWETQGSVVNIDNTDVIEFTLEGNATSAKFHHGDLYLGRSGNNGLDDNSETVWMILENTASDNDPGGFYLAVGTASNAYRLRYNTGMGGNDKFRCYSNNTGAPVYLYVQGGAAGVATPVISPASGNYAEDQEVTITCGTTGATIYYTINGGDTQTYSEPFNVDVDEEHTSTTIVAWAVKDNVTSEQATVTYTYKNLYVNSIEEFLALADGDSAIFKNPVVVLFDYSQNSSNGQEYIWVKDRTGYTQFFIAPQFDAESVADPQYEGTYGQFVPKYENGDVIPAGFKVKKEKYSTGNYYQGQCYATHSSFQVASEKALADPEQVTLSELLANPAAYNNRYLFINKLQVNYSGTGLSFTISADEDGDGTAEVEGGNSVVGYNKYNSPAWKDKDGNEVGVTLPEDNNYYNVKFIFQKWSQGYEIMPIEFIPWEETSLRLEDLVEVGELNHPYTISNQLHATAVTWDGDRNMFAIFAKDDHAYANKRYPAAGQETYLIRYENQTGTFINEVEQEDYDQSNWIEILIPSTFTEVTSKTDVNAYQQMLGGLQDEYEGKILKAATVKGNYIDQLNPTIQVTSMPEAETAATYEPNIYCTANFLMENLDSDGALGNDGNYFMMDAKPHEFCKVVWAYYDNGNGNYFVIPAREGNVVNGHNFHGSFMANLSLSSDADIYYDYNNLSRWIKNSNDESFNGQQFLYSFDAVVRKNPNYTNPANGAPRRIQPGTGDFEQTPGYIVYPIISNHENPEGVVGVKEILGNKTIESVHYYNMMGMESKTPFEGINIVVTRYTDGSTSTIKVMK